MRGSIRQVDIDKGVHNSPARCPLARAIRRTRPGLPVVYVGSESLHILPRGGRWLEFNLSPELRTWIRRYDSGYTVAPTTFRFDF